MSDITTHFVHPSLKEKAKEIYVPQFEPRQKVEEIITSHLPDFVDSPEWHTCAMCCVKMIIKALDMDNGLSISSMFKTAKNEYGVYQVEESGKIIGAIHHELEEYIYCEFGLNASAVRNINSWYDVAQILGDNQFFIASVSPSIRKKSKKGSRGEKWPPRPVVRL